MVELPVDSLLTVAEAIRILDAMPVAPRTEEVALVDADGRVLARDVVADRDYPPFDRSLVDGYAVRAGDSDPPPLEGGARGGVRGPSEQPLEEPFAQSTPPPPTADRRSLPLKVGGVMQLRCVGEVAAGKSFDRALQPGECVAIMTGAPLPVAADACVPIERTSRGTGFQPVQSAEARVENPCDDVLISSPVKVGDLVARRASDLAAGAIALRRGTVIGPAQLAVLAQVGVSRVTVFTRPRAAILVTGDEIVDVIQMPAGSQIRDCNSYLLRSLLTRLGCEVVHVARCADTPDSTRRAIEACLHRADVTFITGGMSMGAYDYVPRTLIELGFDLAITKLRIKPGKPFVVGSGQTNAATPVSSLTTDHRSLTTIFGLPGNPVSAFCCTVRLAARVIDRLRGLPAPGERWIAGPLACDLSANGPREFYQPAQLRDDGAIEPLDWKGSGDVFTLARADVLLVREENEPARRAGEIARGLLLP